MTKPLTEKKFEALVSLSKSKMNEMRDTTMDIGDDITGILYPNSRKHVGSFVDKFHNHIVNTIDGRVGVVRHKRVYLDGWFNIDPYFLANFRPVYPIVKLLFHDKGITTYNIKNNYNANMVNAKIMSMCGEQVHGFLAEFNARGRAYYQTLVSNEIVDSPQFPSFSSNGISKSIIQDILGRMRGFRKCG